MISDLIVALQAVFVVSYGGRGDPGPFPLILSMNKDSVFDLLAVGLGATILIGGIVGWGMNVYKIIHSDFQHIDGELVIRVIGVPAGPIGAIMGYVP